MPISCFTIDSRSSLNKAISSKQQRIKLCGEEEIVREFFNKEPEFQKIIHLEIVSQNFSMMFQNGLVRIIKKGLEYLDIQADGIEELGGLYENLNFYSALKHINIGFREYVSAEVKKESEVIFRGIVDKNRQMRHFLEKELPEYAYWLTHIESKDPETEQIQFFMFLGEHREFYQKARSFNPSLTEDKTFEKITKLAQDWNIRSIVSSNNIQRFKKITPFMKGYDFNQKFKVVNNFFERLIDQAVSAQAVDMVFALREQGAELTCAFENKIPLKPPGAHFDMHRNLSSFPFLLSIQIEKLKDFFLNSEEAVYDALAWFVYSNELREFCESVEKTSVKIDLNKPILKGAFKEFTLFQLIIYYKRTNFFLELIENLSNEEKQKLARSLYPNVDSFPYAGWSILSVVIYQGQDEEFTNLFSKEMTMEADLLRNSQYETPFQLLFYGARRPEAGNLNRRDSDTLRLNSYEKCFDYWVAHNAFNENLKDLVLYDDDNKTEIPLLSYVILNSLFSIIGKHVEKFKESLLKKTYISKFECDLNPLQLAAIEDRYTGLMISPLFEVYRKYDLLEVCNESITCLNDENLFQYSMVNNYLLFQLILTWDKCNVNAPFPNTHKKYPGWRPIHVVTLRECINTGFLELLLTRADLDIAIPFSDQNGSHSLENYYPSSAIFFCGNPRKHDILPPRIISNYIHPFLKLIEKLPKGKKRSILDQALYFAIIHHNPREGHDHADHIKAITGAGANPYQLVGEQGYRIIDVAKERGLLFLFPQHLSQQNKKLSNNIFIKSGNCYRSCLSDFSPTSLYVNEDSTSVISLLRNKNSQSSEHVFLVVEQMCQGLSKMHFIDFVQNKSKLEEGKVRHKAYEGKITESLLYRCDLSMMEILRKEDLICNAWSITNEACEKILNSVENDKAKKINYALMGKRSFFSWSSSKQGHNCYSWAREKLLATEDERIEETLKPSLEEWLITMPSLKEKLTFKNIGLFFGFGVALASIAYVGITSYNDESYSSFKPPT